MRKIFLLPALLSCLVQAEHLKQTKPERIKIRANASLSVVKYYAGKNAFEVELVKEPAQGPFYVTPDDLQSAIAIEGKLPDFIKQMQKDSSAIYVLSEPLFVLKEPEFKARKAK